MITNEQRELIGNLVDKATPTLFNGIQKRMNSFSFFVRNLYIC